MWIFIRECSWDQHLWKGGQGSRTGKREELNLHAIPEVGSDHSTVRSGAGMTPQTLIPLPLSVIVCGRSLEKDLTLGKAISSSPRQSSGRADR